MKPKVIVCIVGVTLLITVVITVGFLYANEDESSSILERFNTTTQNFDRVAVSSVVVDTELVAKERKSGKDYSTDGGSTDGGTGGVGGNFDSPFEPIHGNDILDVASKVKAYWHSLGFPYVDNGKTYSLVDTDGTTYEVRPDCSGFCSYVFFCMGLTKNTQYTTSGILETSMPALGFKRIKINDASDLRPGDVLSYSGHMEIYHSMKSNGSMVVYNWGGKSSVAVPGTTTSGHKVSALICVYRR